MSAHRKSRIATAVAMALALPAVPLAYAQDANPPTPTPTPTMTLPRVLVTGSNIKRIDVETSDSVVVVRREDIEHSGATTLAELFKTLPWTTAPLDDTTGGKDFAAGASAVALRNLGKQATLVLLNGRRLSPYGMPDFGEVFTNIDTLPLDAVERVEILKSGASAIYGSDAVAGVINIITRPDYRGFEVGVDMQQSLPGHSFGSRSFHATAGFGDLDADGFNVVANVQHYRRDAVMWRDVMDRTGDESRAYLPQGQDQLSTYSYPGNIGEQAVQGCNPQLVANGMCMYDRYARFEAQPAAERTNLLVAGRLTLTRDIEGFGDILLSKTKTIYKNAFADYGLGYPVRWGNPSTGALEQFHYFPLPPTHPLNTTGDYAELRYRFVDSNERGEVTGDDYRLVAGLRGNVAGYEWESAIARLGSSVSQEWQGAFSKSGFSQMIGGTTDTSDPNSEIDPNFFNLPGGYRIGQANSPEVLNTLFPKFGFKGRTTQTAWDGKVSGELGELAAGPVGFAAGFDVRRETYRVRPSENLAAGDIVGNGFSQTEGQRNFGAVFGELNVPVTRLLEAQVAARLDKYPGFAAHVSPKLGLRFQPAKELLLRGTVEGGFRAPNLTESARTNHMSFSQTADPKRCGPADAYASDLRAQAAALPESDPAALELWLRAEQVIKEECAAGLLVATSHNPELKPEVSTSATLGLVFEPMQSVSMALDYWNVQRKNEIRAPGTDEVLLQEDNPLAGTSITRAPIDQDQTFTTPELRQQYGVTAGTLVGVSNRFENTSRTKTDGVDFIVKGKFGTPIGGVDLSLAGTYLNSYRSFSGGAESAENLAGVRGFPRLRANVEGAVTTGPYLNGLHLAYQGGTKSPIYCTESEANYCTVASWVRTDYFFAYTGIRDLTFSAYVRNLFNRKPPLDYLALRSEGFTTPPVEEAIGRSLRLSVNYKFY